MKQCSPVPNRGELERLPPGIRPEESSDDSQGRYLVRDHSLDLTGREIKNSWTYWRAKGPLNQWCQPQGIVFVVGEMVLFHLSIVGPDFRGSGDLF